MPNSVTIARTTLDFDRGAIPLYQQLATFFRRRIETGDWPVEQRIPTLDDLVSEFGVARATVRQALGMLEGEGLLSRQRGRGTFVTARPDSPFWCELETDWVSVMHAHEGARIELLESVEATSPPRVLHEEGRLAPAYQYLRRRHWRDGTPYLVGDVYLDRRVYDRAPKSAFRRVPTLRILHDMGDIRIGRARQTLMIGTADIEVASLLQVPLNTPTAILHRTVVDRQGTIICVSRGIYRGEFVRLDMALK